MIQLELPMIKLLYHIVENLDKIKRRIDQLVEVQGHRNKCMKGLKNTPSNEEELDKKANPRDFQVGNLVMF
jgi:hypothetical protein